MLRTITGVARQNLFKSQSRLMALRAPANSNPMVPDLFGWKESAKRKETVARIASDPLLANIEDKKPIKVAITGAAGSIGYALLFRICNGELLGPDQPLKISCIELPIAMNAMAGVAMEIDDCAFPLVKELKCTSEQAEGFEGADIVLCVGSVPRGPGMERSDLIKVNGESFQKLGQNLNTNAEAHCRVVVVGNPCNTNCMIAANNAPNLKVENFTAMTRLDHDRAIGILSKKSVLPPNEINNVCVWGNHSASMYADSKFTTFHGTPMKEIFGNWRLERFRMNELVPTVQQRGAQIIAARGASSAASAANACIAHTRDWCLGSSQPDWTSMGVVSGGEYGVPPGLVFSYPVLCTGGAYEIVNYPSMFDEHQQYQIERNIAELELERDVVAGLLPN